MRSAVPLFRTPAAPWAMIRSPRRTAAAMPKRSPPLPSIDCRMASTLTGALSSSDEPGGLDRSDFDASIMFYRGRIGLRTETAPINLSDSSRRMWSIHQLTKCSNRWFRFTGYRAAKQQDSDLAPDSRRAPSGAYCIGISRLYNLVPPVSRNRSAQGSSIPTTEPTFSRAMPTGSLRGAWLFGP